MVEAAETERLRGEIRRLRAELLVAITERDELKTRVLSEQSNAVQFADQVQEIRNSMSWRVTAPLRRASRMVRP